MMVTSRRHLAHVADRVLWGIAALIVAIPLAAIMLATGAVYLALQAGGVALRRHSDRVR